MNKLLDLLTHSLVAFGSKCGEMVGATVDVAVEGEVVRRECVNHLLGLLGGGGIVEVDQLMAINLRIENGKIHRL